MYSIIESNIHYRHLNSLEQFICATSMTNIRPGRDSNQVPLSFVPTRTNEPSGWPWDTSRYNTTVQSEQAVSASAYLSAYLLVKYADTAYWHCRADFFYREIRTNLYTD